MSSQNREIKKYLRLVIENTYIFMKLLGMAACDLIVK